MNGPQKPYRNLPLNPLRAFAVASRHRTFTAAAAQLGVSQVAVSRQISTLEAFLGVKLFDRGSRSARLTDVGRAFGTEVSEIFERMELALQRLGADPEGERVTLRIYPTIAHYWLLPRIAEFERAHPGITVELDTVVEPLDFRSTPLEVAVQLGHGTWRDARSQKLFDEVVDVVCSPGYAARHDGFRDPAALEAADLLHARYRRREWEIWAAAAGLQLDLRDGMEFDTSLLLYGAAREGLGLAIGQLALLEAEIASGQLIRPLDRPVTTGAGFYVVWPMNRAVAPGARALIDWMLSTAGLPVEFGSKG